jgi:cysteine desulfurase/selenocysteine lyase
MIDGQKIKLDFPILQNHSDLVYLDSAATSQKPQSVIDAIAEYYQNSNANVHRGVHQLSDDSTQVWEDSRKEIANFLGAKNEELILTRNATEALNGVTYGWGDHNLKTGDIIISTQMEHHANLVPWQELAKRTGAKLELIEITAEGQLDLAQLKQILTENLAQIKLLAVTHVSNTLGTVNPVSEIAQLLKKYAPQAKLVIDGAQAVPHLKIDFDKLGADFYAFSGHKMLGPMGVGALLVKKELLNSEEMKPWLFGGGMINAVFDQTAEYHPQFDQRFTAGTPDVASTRGLAVACQYLDKLDMAKVTQHDLELLNYAWQKLSELDFVKLLGPQPNLDLNSPARIGSVSFTVQGVHPHDVAQVLASNQVAVRSGHHCCMPLHQALSINATVRASFNVYNSKTDIDQLIVGLEKVKKTFLN